MFDLAIINGEIIDPATGISEKKDIFINNEHFIEEPIKGKQDAEKIIDAKGCYVCPGFIDGHTHVYWGGSGELSTKADISCLPNGVTTAIDAGSTSIANFESFYKNDIINSETNIKALLHPCITGIQLPPAEEDENPDNFDAGKILRMFMKYPNVLKGLKIRMSKGTIRDYGIKPIVATREIANQINDVGLHCVMGVHFSELAKGVSMSEFLDELRSGDIVYHFYHPSGESIFNSDGTIMDCVIKAREKGVLFDSARGRINFSIHNLIKASNHGFYPDIISTDLGRRTLYRKPNFSILHSMSMLLNVGMKIEDIIAAVTCNPACAYGIQDEVGSIELGRVADIAIIKIVDMEKNYSDTFGEKFVGNKLIVPMATIKSGRTVFQQIYMDNELY